MLQLLTLLHITPGHSTVLVKNILKVTAPGVSWKPPYEELICHCHDYLKQVECAAS